MSPPPNQAKFAEVYAQQTGNEWAAIRDGRATFQKKPNKFMALARDLDGGAAAGGGGGQLATVRADRRSSLDPRLQDLMCLIFDVKLMEDSLREMEVDLKKMPLGQLKRSQITAGYEVLSAIQPPHHLRTSSVCCEQSTPHNNHPYV